MSPLGRLNGVFLNLYRYLPTSPEGDILIGIEFLSNLNYFFWYVLVYK